MIALFIGRFQPFHKGHLWAVQHILKDAELVIIGIGSSQDEGTALDPYSAKERRAMIEAALKAAEVKDYALFEIPDVRCDEDWVAHVQKIVPRFDVFYTGSDLSAKLFRDRGLKVATLERHKGINATEIRYRIGKGMKWSYYVDKPVADIIKLIGKARIIIPALPSASRRSPSSARCHLGRA
jgi:nicotinamide-nucleotide adenylyltransferase